MMYWLNWYSCWGFSMIWWILMIIFWWIVIYFFIQIINQNSFKKESRDAMSILKERYAKWEITKKEFEEMKKDLM
ncbi:MAG: hypothetical protein ACD_3C00025G0004 [uncultured bacterium (gcode 4)]|uniref:SHOCT domain-containing protein n=1 Tax=uncultured bacterium (gcode 4) TaxID=1234023 RepID=K2GZ28_9BACT|nr:MAG: hypothetical protein ACD_3C00025G0004 [uncultured bacterium (gcode 4)]